MNGFFLCPYGNVHQRDLVDGRLFIIAPYAVSEARSVRPHVHRPYRLLPRFLRRHLSSSGADWSIGVFFLFRQMTTNRMASLVCQVESWMVTEAGSACETQSCLIMIMRQVDCDLGLPGRPRGDAQVSLDYAVFFHVHGGFFSLRPEARFALTMYFLRRIWRRGSGQLRRRMAEGRCRIAQVQDCVVMRGQVVHIVSD